MKKIYVLVALLSVMFLSGCTGRAQYETEDMYGVSPRCRQETTIAVYDKNGMHTFPGCADYEYVSYNDNSGYEDVIIERDFPLVPNNKYDSNQVIMENLNTRVLAYCRGSQEEIEMCVATLEDSCYTRLSEVPYVAAKYDSLTTGTYPTRRWRNGQNVPRW